MRVLILTLAVTAAVLAGCNPETPSAIEPAAVLAAPEGPASVPAAAMSDQAVMATVNGKPILMGALNEILVRDFGWQSAQQLIADELVSQHAAGKNITVDQKDIDAETDAVLKRAMGEAPSPERREATAAQLCQQLRITPQMWNNVMRRQAMLRKLAADRVKITPADLQAEFNDQYGRRVTIRDIQVASQAEAEKILTTLQEANEADREQKFAEIATRQSGSASARSGGLIEGISASTTDSVPASVRDAALKLDKKGQLSSVILADTKYHILYLVSAEEPKDAKLEDVKPRLEESIRDKQIEVLQQQLLMEMSNDAFKNRRIEFVNPILKAKFEEAQRAKQQAEGK